MLCLTQNTPLKCDKNQNSQGYKAKDCKIICRGTEPKSWKILPNAFFWMFHITRLTKGFNTSDCSNWWDITGKENCCSLKLIWSKYILHFSSTRGGICLLPVHKHMHMCLCTGTRQIHNWRKNEFLQMLLLWHHACNLHLFNRWFKLQCESLQQPSEQAVLLFYLLLRSNTSSDIVNSARRNSNSDSMVS